ncbi:MAG: DNA polymerase III subunit gamma/tau [Rickettsiaceae bacterium]|nr:DNA polymerase III subunit gamma/tau [Rickettsiaceae bacterium]
MSQNQKVLARKYRPKSFSEIFGQDVLVRTLNNAILHDKLHHAYLLHGIRGVGKTTTARMIANIVNCSQPTNQNGMVDSCKLCQNCRGVEEANHPDIIEFDAASKTGVDDIRDVLDSCEYRPMLGKYKVFIIDEVHMLSKNAFNALLKVLEEPPSHVMFIFATTELNKIPLTIISRCQKFDLQRISQEKLVKLFEQICIKEGINFSNDALALLAIKSDGSARDGLSLLFHLSSSLKTSEDKVTVELINDMLASIKLDDVVQLFSYIIHGDGDKIIAKANNIYQNNYDFLVVIDELLELTSFLAKKLLIKNYNHPKYNSYQLELNSMLEKLNSAKLDIMWQILKNGVYEIKAGYTNALTIFEMLMMRLLFAGSIESPAEIIHDAFEEASQQQQVIPTDGIYVFLDHLYATRNFDIYHYLLNEVAVIKYENEIIEISELGSSVELNKKLLQELSNWTSKEWSVKVKHVDKPISLKKSLITTLENSNQWKTIKKLFIEAKIADIIHK